MHTLLAARAPESPTGHDADPEPDRKGVEPARRVGRARTGVGNVDVQPMSQLRGVASLGLGIISTLPTLYSGETIAP